MLIMDFLHLQTKGSLYTEKEHCLNHNRKNHRTVEHFGLGGMFKDHLILPRAGTTFTRSGCSVKKNDVDIT